jgi:hypothetical protein
MAQSDRYGGEWVTQAFRGCGVHCVPAPKPKSDLYKELLPLIKSRRVELLDHPKLVGQLCRRQSPPPTPAGYAI